MGLEQWQFDILKTYTTEDKSIAFLGYPDILSSIDYININKVKNEEHIKRWHGFNGNIYDAQDYLSKLFGFSKIDYYDVYDHTGLEKILDLNYISSEFNIEDNRYDFVFDNGTAEHCFNIGAVFHNIHNMCKENGIILQANPINMVNHGFYCISPTLFHDFYTDLDYTIDKYLIYGSDINNRKVKELNNQLYTSRLHAPEDGLSSFVILQKNKHIPITKYPIQSKYRTRHEKNNSEEWKVTNK